MTSLTCSAGTAIAQKPTLRRRELFARAFVEPIDLAALASVTVAALAMAAALALTLLGGA